MKKILLIVMALLLLVGCTNKQDNTPTFDTKKAEEIAITVASDLLEGKVEEVYSLFDEQMKEALPVDSLKNGLEPLYDLVGEYLDKRTISLSEYAMNNTYYAVEVLEEHSVQDIIVQVTFDLDYKIAGLAITQSTVKNEDYELLEIEQEIVVGSEESMPLDGVLTLPKSDGQSPLVILVQGSGQTDRDETIGLNKPFKDIAQGLAKHGIASIRYDKRYYTYPDKAPSNLTIEQEIIDDLYSVIEYAKKHENVDVNNIYVLGHSLGGMLVPSILNERDDLKGAIILAGSPRSLEDIIYDQNMEVVNSVYDTLNEEAQKEIDAQIETLKNDIVKIKELDENSEDEVLIGINSSYWKSLNNRAATKYLSSIDEPLCIMQGSADFQVYADVDYKMFQDLLKGKANVEFHLYENLNHLFMESEGKRDISEYNVAKNVEPEVIDDIANFILNN